MWYSIIRLADVQMLIVLNHSYGYSYLLLIAPNATPTLQSGLLYLFIIPLCMTKLELVNHHDIFKNTSFA